MDIYICVHKDLKNKTITFEVDNSSEVKSFKIGKTLNVDNLVIGKKYQLKIYGEYVNDCILIKDSNSKPLQKEKKEFNLNKNILIQHYSSDSCKLLEILQTSKGLEVGGLNRKELRALLLKEHKKILTSLLRLHNEVLDN